MFRLISIIAAFLRLLVAAGLTAVCAQALPAWDAETTFAALPDYDYYEQAEKLRIDGRYSEALLVVEAGFGTKSSYVQDASLLALRQRIMLEKDDALRRLTEFGQGALSGTGESVEALTGAVVADLFVYGDLRDLVLQAQRQLQGEEVDEVLVGLSAAGLVLTATPSADFGTAVLKFARRAGALTDHFARRLMQLLGGAMQRGEIAALLDVASDTGKLAYAAQPAVAVSILRHIDDPARLPGVARLAQQPGGAFALWLGERSGLDLLKATAGETLLLRAARKGRAGIEMAKDNLYLLTKPHPLLGLIKSVYGDRLPRLLAAWLARQAPALLGLAFGWLIYECGRFASRLMFRPGARSEPRPAPEPPPPPPQKAERREPRL